MNMKIGIQCKLEKAAKKCGFLLLMFWTLQGHSQVDVCGPVGCRRFWIKIPKLPESIL